VPPDKCLCVRLESLFQFSVLLGSLHMEQGFPAVPPPNLMLQRGRDEKAALFGHCLAVLALDRPLIEA